MRNIFKRRTIQKPETPEIPVHTQWIIGWKAANVYVLENLRTLSFIPIHQDGFIYTSSVDDKAKCQQRSHSSPTESCRCGFNAWNDVKSALKHYDVMKRKSGLMQMQRESLVILRVGLYGDVIEGTSPANGVQHIWGYRASRQRVADIFFEEICCMCSEQADELGVYRHDIAWGWVLRPFCEKHLGEASHVVNPADLTHHNDVEIHWGLPSE